MQDGDQSRSLRAIPELGWNSSPGDEGVGQPVDAGERRSEVLTEAIAAGKRRRAAIAVPCARSVVEPRPADVVVVHTEVMTNFMQHRVVDLVDEFGVGPAPTFDVVLQQHDPLGIPGRTERRLGRALKVPQHVLVDPTHAVVVGGVRLDGDQEVVVIHSSAQRRRNAIEGRDGNALEFVRGDVIRHPVRMSYRLSATAAARMRLRVCATTRRRRAVRRPSKDLRCEIPRPRPPHPSLR